MNGAVQSNAEFPPARFRAVTLQNKESRNGKLHRIKQRRLTNLNDGGEKENPAWI